LDVLELNNCDPIIKVSDLWTNQKYSLNEMKKTEAERIPMDENLPAIPCGLVAKSIFNDTFQLWKEKSGDET
jgi:hypothetical protein